MSPSAMARPLVGEDILREPLRRFGRQVKLSTVIRGAPRSLRTGDWVEVRLGDGSIVRGPVLVAEDGVIRIGLDGA